MQLLFADRTLDQAGIVIGPDGKPVHLKTLPAGDPATPGYAAMPAVTGACLAIPRALFEQLGGFDEGYRARHHDVDLCLRARERGASVVCSPWPRPVCRDPGPDPGEDEIDRALLIDAWFDRLDAGDPYLTRMLTPDMTPVQPVEEAAR